MKYQNDLINETSPYLLQHAHNPVNWFPWGDKALAIAKEKDLPILVSIGYSACHWCHVMERESFENELVAAYMNEHFVNIKIDREERPDLDHLYMDALQAISGSGGWPLNMFLTPDGRPFYGGTYFPPEKAFNRPSWLDVLHSMTDVWINKRDEAEQQANTLVEHIKKSNAFGDAKSFLPITETVDFFNKDDCRLMKTNLLKSADTTDGGFGKAPKFLQTFSLQYLIQYAHLFSDEVCKDHAVFTLKKMLHGGIYDQLAGGISRYSTDDQWLAPHFEKMLYDNALFAGVLCDAYQLTRESFLADGIRSTLDFFINEMKHPQGGYFTALDADSEGDEGKYYVWQKEEIDALLGGNAPLFCAYYNVSEEGNWEGKNILNIQLPALAIADKFNIDIEEFDIVIKNARQILLNARIRRTKPGTDDKILLGNNALFITALCKGYCALQDENYKAVAIDLHKFLVLTFKNEAAEEALFHTYKNEQARYPAFLDDYAYFIQACINLQEITSNQEYLVKARDLTDYVLKNFADEKSPYFFYTNMNQHDIVVRKIDLYDGAIPSANAIMAQNLFYLGTVFDNSSWYSLAGEMLHSVFNALKKYPSSFAVWGSIYLLQTGNINEIIIAGENIKLLLKQVLDEYIPNKILQSSTQEYKLPLLQDKNYLSEGKIYLCKNYSCFEPVYTVLQLMPMLKYPDKKL